jgi:pyridoxamine 5'-phosphate oxidase
MSQDISQVKDWLTAWKIFYEPEMDLEKTDPNAASISSVDSTGVPNNRIILLKDVNEEGFLFYTNFKSQKGKELFGNGKGAITWWSRAQHKSVRAQGEIIKANDQTSNEYFASRSRDAQISTSISKQSEILKSREKLEQEWNDFKEKHEGQDIKRPEHWGGIYLKPNRVEFWQSTKDYSSRLHDRVVFRLESSTWVTERLYP